VWLQWQRPDKQGWPELPPQGRNKKPEVNVS
jgi:hypothetical protein